LQLVFVYNAKANRIHKMFDFAHKIISPATYPCDLCALTHGHFGEREDWTTFLQESNFKIEFHHIEDFEQKYGLKDEYPIIYTRTSDSLKPLLNAKEIAKLNDVNELTRKLKSIVNVK